MDNQTKVVIVVIVITILVVCVINPKVFGIEKEPFDEQNNGIVQLSAQNPKQFEPDVNTEIEKTPLVGLPNEFIPAWGDDSPYKYGDFDILNDGANGNMGMGFNMCSKSCCSTQYPPPFGLPVDPLVCGSKKEFLPSSYTCNNGWQDSGCLCMSKEQSEFLNSRGNNA